MADLKEKLVELLYNSPQLDVLGGLSYYEEAADNLIANGVTFAEDNNVPSKWISVNDRLPEKWQNVLVVREGGAFRFDFIGSLDVWYDDVNFCDPVTHWMPLPEPPKE